MPIDTTDIRSNSDRQILHAADLLSKSEDRRKVFSEIYRGKTTGKTAEEIASEIGMDSGRVLQIALILFQGKIVNRQKISGRWTYSKDDFINLNKNKILRLAINDPARAKLRAYIFPNFSDRATLFIEPSTKQKSERK